MFLSVLLAATCVVDDAAGPDRANDASYSGAKGGEGELCQTTWELQLLPIPAIPFLPAELFFMSACLLKLPPS